MLWVKASNISTADQVRIAQQRLAEQVDVAERRAYEVRGPGWVMQQYTYWVGITLLGTNISPQNGMFEDDFSFSPGGIC